jgi:hypothetical protein
VAQEVYNYLSITLNKIGKLNVTEKNLILDEVGDMKKLVIILSHFRQYMRLNYFERLI